MEDYLVPNQKFAVVALVGAPNSGKSTLMNRIVGVKLSIVSPKVQTTRNNIVGLFNRRQVQLVFIDTPGLFRPKKRLQRAMVDSAWSSARDADQVVFLLDSSTGITDSTKNIIEEFTLKEIPVTIALNKTDLVHPTRLLGVADFFSSKKIGWEIFMISALTGDGVQDLVKSLLLKAKEGPWHYPEDQLTDLPLRYLAEEITREALFLQLQQELPYSCMVGTDGWRTLVDKSVRVNQTICVERESHKLIVVGNNGDRIKAISRAARKGIAKLLGVKTHLFVRVKVDKGWGERKEYFNSLGLKYDV
ncbi:MAG: GTPase Era [Rhodospirillaceae bacterium]|nr:GTPase Era [Rhodospirillaceae bacterium]